MGFSNFMASARRILVVSKKPTRNEYMVMAKITGLGILLIALIAFIVWAIASPLI